jgi:diguanylate cyclase (GGDEF)-like protein
MAKDIIAVVMNNLDDLDRITSMLHEEGFQVECGSSEEDLFSLMERSSITVLIIERTVVNSEGQPVCETIRKLYPGLSMQIMIVTESPETVQPDLCTGGDDFICRPLSPLEFITRIKAALIRQHAQNKLYNERDFFRNAVRHEEELSNQILDQHLHLKVAFENIEKINHELEISNKKLERIARYDTLSGLLNRMSLFHTIDVEIERAIRTGRLLSGIMIDLDHFKDINDNYGHQTGDEAISMAGTLLLEEMRKYDHAGRYGGEEFFVILPDSSMKQARSIAERIRGRFNNTPLKCGGETLTVTASFGVSSFRPGESREHWMARADRAMYRAKQAGRNRVVGID